MSLLGTWITGGLDKIWDKATDVAHAVTGIPTADEKRNQARMVNDQIKSYREQTNLAKSELAVKRDEKVAEKRRVDEKQVRALRRNYRAASFLGGQDTTQPDMNSKLGG